MAKKGHNNPPKILELTDEEAKFLLDNCDTNIAFGLSALQQVSRETAEKLVAQMEMFKAIRTKLRDS